MNASPTAIEEKIPPGSAVARAVEGLRRLIVSRQLLPGEQIRQAETASLLRVSRIPLREALKVLETEGLLNHNPNQGYFIAKLSAEELAQIYRMRELLETELITSLSAPDPALLEHLSQVNDDLERAGAEGAIESVVAKNRTFHFAIFDASPLQLVAKEVRRLWDISDAYRVLYLTDEGVRHRIAVEHREILNAWAREDHDAMIASSNKHRSGAARRVASMLGLAQLAFEPRSGHE